MAQYVYEFQSFQWQGGTTTIMMPEHLRLIFRITQIDPSTGAPQVIFEGELPMFFSWSLNDDFAYSVTIVEDPADWTFIQWETNSSNRSRTIPQGVASSVGPQVFHTAFFEDDTAAPPPPPTGPALSVTPTSGQAGDLATLHGQNFDPNRTVNVYWSGLGLVDTFTAPTTGNFERDFVVASDTPPGQYTITTMQEFGGPVVEAATSFTVNQSTVPDAALAVTPATVTSNQPFTIAFSEYEPMEDVQLSINAIPLEMVAMDAQGEATIVRSLDINNYGEGTHTLRGLGRSGRAAEATLTLTGTAPPGVEMSMTAPPFAYAGKWSSHFITVRVNGQPISQSHRVRWRLRREVIPFVLYEDMIDGMLGPEAFDESGVSFVTFEIPNEWPGDTFNLERGGRIVIDLLQMPGNVAIGTESMDIMVQGRIVSIQISEQRAEPDQIDGHAGDEFTIRARIGATAQGNPIRAWVNLYEIVGEQVNPVEGARIVSEDPVGPESPVQYAFTLTVPNALEPGQRLRYAIFAGSHDEPSNSVISDDDIKHVDVQVGPKSLEQQVRDWLPWILLGGGVAIGGGVAYKVLAKPKDEFRDIKELTRLQMYRSMLGKGGGG